MAYYSICFTVFAYRYILIVTFNLAEPLLVPVIKYILATTYRCACLSLEVYRTKTAACQKNHKAWTKNS